MVEAKRSTPPATADANEQPTLRVMRLYKPRLDACPVLPSCSVRNRPRTQDHSSLTAVAVSTEAAGEAAATPTSAATPTHPAAAAAAAAAAKKYSSPSPASTRKSAREEGFALSSSLKLPDSFGNIYLGETFTAYISVLNPLPNTVFLNVSLSAKLQVTNTNNKVDLEDRRMARGATVFQPNPASSLRPGENLDMIVEHKLEELESHTLRVTVSYDVPAGVAAVPEGSPPRVMRKFYRFSVMSPLAMSSVCTSVRGKPFVQLELRNTTQMDLLLESCDFIPEEGVAASLVGSTGHCSLLPPSSSPPPPPPPPPPPSQLPQPPHEECSTSGGGADASSSGASALVAIGKAEKVTTATTTTTTTTTAASLATSSSFHHQQQQQQRKKPWWCYRGGGGGLDGVVGEGGLGDEEGSRGEGAGIVMGPAFGGEEKEACLTAVERFDRRVLLCPEESYQLLYSVRSDKVSSKVAAMVMPPGGGTFGEVSGGKEAGRGGGERGGGFEEGSHPLGQVEVFWRTTTGESGSVRSPPVIFDTPDRPEVEVTLGGLPEALQLGKVAECVATVHNRSGRQMALQLRFRTDGMVGVYVHGQSFRNLGELAPGTSVRCPLQLIALVAGLHELRGCTVADMHTAQEFQQGKLRDILVEFPQEEDEEEVVFVVD